LSFSLSVLALYFGQQPLALAVAAGLLGLIVGSFLNVVVYRLPLMLQREWRRQCQEMLALPADAAGERFDLLMPRSRCPQCGHTIRAWENIPVLSFLVLRGRCAACGARISWRYPLVELLTGVLSALVAWHFGWQPATAAGLALTWTLIALTFIDLDHQLLPDVITLPVLWLGLGLNVVSLFTTPSAAILGAIAGYLFLWVVFQGFRLATGKEGMGYGDFKLYALGGAWLGWSALPVIILLASFVGALVGLVFIVFRGHDRRVPIPFGPYLCAAIWVALLWQDALLTAYLQLGRLAG
jgi:leader peptidase (prepilin peptidase)/N-methyltransferase